MKFLNAVAMTAKKHHYIPKCYLRQWVGVDGRLHAFSRPHVRVEERRLHPSQTGYIENLYAVATMPEGQRDVLEKEFFSRVDQDADDVLKIFLSGGQIDSARHQNGWSRFLMSLLQRHPARVETIREQAATTFAEAISEIGDQYAALRKPTDPATLAEFLKAPTADSIARFSGMLLQNFSDLPGVGEHLNRMFRTVVHVHNPRWKFLTSDRPLLISGGLAAPNASVVLPISPNHVFLATNSKLSSQGLIERIGGGELIPVINDRVVRQAWKWVYASDLNQVRFIEKRFPMRAD